MVYRPARVVRVQAQAGSENVSIRSYRHKSDVGWGQLTVGEVRTSSTTSGTHESVVAIGEAPSRTPK